MNIRQVHRAPSVFSAHEVCRRQAGGSVGSQPPFRSAIIKSYGTLFRRNKVAYRITAEQRPSCVVTRTT